jgi:hypothetical protein
MPNFHFPKEREVMVWYPAWPTGQDIFHGNKRQKKKEIAREDALTLFYQLFFFQEEGIILF